MGEFHDMSFPGESDDYRKARDQLLAAEMELRRRLDEVAALRGKLPLGGPLKEDYVFEEGATDLSDQETLIKTRLSELFDPERNSLLIYSFMYPPDAETPCPMCTALLDSLNGNAPHVEDRINLAVVARAPTQKIRTWAKERGWTNLRLLSSGENTYNLDYFAETPEGGQLPAINVFQKTDQGVHHFYNAELLYAKAQNGQHPRHADLIWPLWNLLDLTPVGRGTDWYPKVSYSKEG